MPKSSGVVSFLVTCSMITGAIAQTAQSVAPAESGDIQEITVTATRVAPSGFSAPTPTTVISQATLEQQQVTNLGEALNLLPSFKGDISPAASGIRTQLPGAEQADLRGIGAQRTLVLVDGMRVVPQAPANNTGVATVPDMNQIPALMVQRVEVVTGGASAQWGSDAVSGVVNILLRNDFTGFEVTGQGGATQYGDDGNERIGVLFGTPFAGDRGHLVVAIDASNVDEMGDINSRPWGRQDYQLLTNPSPQTNGLPNFLITPNVLPTSSSGGLITGPANFGLKGYYFTPGGTPAPFKYGALAGGQSMIGGQGQSEATGVSLSPGVLRADPYVHVSFNVSEHLSLFAEGGFAYVKGETNTLPSRDTADNISINNAYLPAGVAAEMAAANVTSFTLSRINYDLGGNLQVTTTNSTPHVAIGTKGDLSDNWTWDSHLSWGENFYDQAAAHDLIVANNAFALNSINVGGRIVCAATVPGAAYNPAAAGCVPLNPFGQGSPSAAAINYVTGTERSRSLYEQRDAAADVQGKPLSTWAGPLSVAAGVEYRIESQHVSGDPISVIPTGGYQAANAADWAGSFNVKEVYGEAVVPLAKDSFLANAVNFDTAVRWADYSTVGAATTWKEGLNWELVKGFSLRTTVSRDLRAPALFELYSPGAVSSLPASVNGFSVASIPSNTTVGNPHLKAEVGETFTFGAVFQPVGTGIQASIDYYNINLKDAITSVTNPGPLCSAGQAFFCSVYTYNSAGVPTSLTIGEQNFVGHEAAPSSPPCRWPLRSLLRRTGS
jgi:iron complex outermembrane receptor protein